MKTKRNVLLVNTLISIGLAAAIFVIIGVVFDASCNGNLQMTNYSFSKMAAGVLATGLGFGLPTVIYGNENISLPIQTLIHMGIGCVVMIIGVSCRMDSDRKRCSCDNPHHRRRNCNCLCYLVVLLRKPKETRQKNEQTNFGKESIKQIMST